MNIGCLFGTFDPPHNGHVRIACWMRDHIPFDRVWLVITPDNPFKIDRHKSSAHDRAAMVRLAIEGAERLEVCEEETRLPAPHFTVDSLAHFRKRWPEHRFSLIIGSDNLLTFERWKDPHGILDHHTVIVYPRPGAPNAPIIADGIAHPNLRISDAPLMEVSSTAIRSAIRKGSMVNGDVKPEVRAYALRKRLYAD